jgi:hypothetical protein
MARVCLPISISSLTDIPVSLILLIVQSDITYIVFRKDFAVILAIVRQVRIHFLVSPLCGTVDSVIAID